MERILLPVDGSEYSAMAAPLTSRLVERFSSQLTVLRVLSPQGLEPADFERVQRQAEHDIRSAFSESAKAVVLLSESEPAEVIINWIEQAETDLVVMNSHGHSGLARWLLGSVTEKVCRHGQCVTLVTRGTATQMGHIVVPLDGGAVAEQALVAAATLLEKKGHLTLLRSGLEGDPELDRYLESLAEKLSQRGVATSLVSSSLHPAEAILKELEKPEPDAVALTTRGRTGLSRFLFGSVAEKVLRHARKPTLIVPPEAEFDFESWLTAG